MNLDVQLSLAIHAWENCFLDTGNGKTESSMNDNCRSTQNEVNIDILRNKVKQPSLN
jgi:hypothetical protein